jgi:uncharacterized protein (TIGR01244 family)
MDSMSRKSNHQMLPIKRLSDRMSVSGWLNATDFEGVRALGFSKVVNFRPDNEARSQIASVEAQAAAEGAGLQYVHIPVTKHDLFTDDVVAKAVWNLAAMAAFSAIARPGSGPQSSGPPRRHARCRPTRFCRCSMTPASIWASFGTISKLSPTGRAGRAMRTPPRLMLRKTALRR